MKFEIIFSIPDPTIQVRINTALDMLRGYGGTMKVAAVFGLLGLLLVSPAHGQIRALAPAGWTDLEAWAHGAGLIVDGQRLCGIEYNTEMVQQHFALIASLAGVSVNKFNQAALEAANRQAPHVTRETCHTAERIARRNGMLR